MRLDGVVVCRSARGSRCHYVRVEYQLCVRGPNGTYARHTTWGYVCLTVVPAYMFRLTPLTPAGRGPAGLRPAHPCVLRCKKGTLQRSQSLHGAYRHWPLTSPVYFNLISILFRKNILICNVTFPIYFVMLKSPFNL